MRDDIKMITLILCKNCKHRILLTDEQGNIAYNFCDLDLPNFKKVGTTKCSSYDEKN